MTEAVEIYQRFISTPLRLKTSSLPQTPCQATPSPASDASSEASIVMKLEFTSPEPVQYSPSIVKKLQRGIEEANISDHIRASGTVTSKTRGKKGESTDVGSSRRTRRVAATRSQSKAMTRSANDFTLEWEGNAQTSTTPETQGKTESKKSKRVTRAVKMVNQSTGGEYVDTPTKAQQPPKKSKKVVLQSVQSSKSMPVVATESTNKENQKEVQVNLVHRNIADSLVDSETEIPARQPVRRSRRIVQANRQKTETIAKTATAVEQDLLSPFCDSLIATDTISGSLFALSWNALRPLQDKFFQSTTAGELVASSAFRHIYDVCLAISKCESLATQSQKQFESMSPLQSQQKSGQPLTKCVRFRTFDLSCLNLQYVESKRVAAMVDDILQCYSDMMDHIATTFLQSSKQAKHRTQAMELLEHLIECMRHPEKRSQAPVHLESEAMRIFDVAFTNKDRHTQHEIRVCGDYFAHEFKKLLVPPSSPYEPVSFLHEMFSSLMSSTTRYRLRVLFLSFDDSGLLGNEDDGDQDDPMDQATEMHGAMASYSHQDLGAAIHRALQETFLYTPLVCPVLKLLAQPMSKDDVNEYLSKVPDDDIDYVEQYILARRFLRFHFRKVTAASKTGEFTSKMWLALENVCRLAERLHFEDEAHLFPLASVKEFVLSLEHEQSLLVQLEEALLAFFSETQGASKKDQKECMECHAVITRQETPVSITCTLCYSRYHLNCLHLPDSFAQFASQYTCPSCFLGRRR